MGLNLLSIIRLIMFIFISYIYYTSFADDSVIQKTFIIVAVLSFTINHFLLLITSFGEKHFPLLIGIDLVLTLAFSFLFPGETLFLILVGVSTVTLFLMTNNRNIIVGFAIAFLITWAISLFFSYQVTGKIDILSNLVFFAYIVFSAIVGSLIHWLLNAQEKIAYQYDQLKDTHTDLKDAHQQLHIYSNKVEKLTLIQERNRISREIHDTVGHKMTALLVQLQLAKELQDIQPEKSKATIQVCEELARNALQEIRLSVHTLQEDDDQFSSFLKTTRKLLEEFEKMAGLKSNFHLIGEPSKIPSSIQLNLTRVIQESITNAVRHGQATECDVLVEISNRMIHTTIEDNGSGSSNVSPGFGLTNMRDRVQEHGGSLIFESRREQGFIVKASFPLKEIRWKVGNVDDKNNGC
ncbi:sensor histidine kinase [Aquibacillus halophilus]|uniref:histidine kinase n=1 Tax=Aquibacillus halophilus TaxID=930132 RepID=A0A6A8DHA5_9BACI|nr:sensor histidine kinase [Aquibacillus halophilus]MRH45064.1 sensor histidine kinase [Aquibacillus halophilus]